MMIVFGVVSGADGGGPLHTNNAADKQSQKRRRKAKTPKRACCVRKVWHASQGQQEEHCVGGAQSEWRRESERARSTALT
jgi:hypothetical protein